MSKYFCPDCGFEGDEPICPHCNVPAEALDVSDEEAVLSEKYSRDEIKKAEEKADQELAKEIEDPIIEDEDEID